MMSSHEGIDYMIQRATANMSAVVEDKDGRFC